MPSHSRKPTSRRTTSRRTESDGAARSSRGPSSRQSRSMPDYEVPTQRRSTRQDSSRVSANSSRRSYSSDMSGRSAQSNRGVSSLVRNDSRNNPRTTSTSRRSSASTGRGRSTVSSRAYDDYNTTSSVPKDYSTPGVWTKNQSKSRGSSLGGSSSGRRRGVLGILGFIFGGLAALIVGIFRFFGRLIARSKIAIAVVALVVVLAVGGGVDALLHMGQIHKGVSVGTVDLSGMTAEEAHAALDEAYTERFALATVVIYASEEAKTAVEAGQSGEAEAADQMSVEEARENKLAWQTSTESLEATFPIDEMVESAMAIGRSDGIFVKRIWALAFGYNIEPYGSYSEASLEALAGDIDMTIGNPRVDFNIVVEDGVASVTDGHDGIMMNRTVLEEELNRAFLAADTQDASFVAFLEPAPLRITQEAAQIVCDQVNAAIADGAVFTYGQIAWEATPSMVGGWVETDIVQSGRDWLLVPSLDEDEAKSVVLAHIKENADDKPVTVTFSVSGDDVTVYTDATGTMPLVANAVSDLEAALFGSDEQDAHEGALAADGKPVSVTVQQTTVPERMTFEEALEAGVVSEISTFTTEYTTGSGTEARNHNIHLAAERLHNSVVQANGGEWSFHEVAGECNAAGGFKAAGAIIDGEYVDSVGGGICQVATTVFNAVYESGYPVVRRQNHSLYIASYPAGRDAAVSWPDLDLRWRNDTTSDVLVRMSYTESTVTASLYGVDPGFEVSTTVGEWQEGDAYETIVKVDETYPEGKTTVQTKGENGRRIEVVRTVTDKNGELVSEATFTSNYKPKHEVLVVWPGYEETSESSEDSDEE